MPKTIKQVKRLIGFAQFFRNYIPDLGTKLMPFYHLLKKDRELEVTEEHRKSLATIKQDLLRATEITLRLPKPGLQYVILCDASYHGTGFVLMVEDYVKENNSGEKKRRPMHQFHLAHDCLQAHNSSSLFITRNFLHCILHWIILQIISAVIPNQS